MDEELKGRVEKIVIASRMCNRHRLMLQTEGEVTEAILALVVAERDSMKEAAIQHRPTQCHEATGYLTRCECGWKSAAHRINWQEGEPDEIEQGIEEWKAHVRSLTPSTAQSREREIAEIERKARLEELDLVLDVANREDRYGAITIFQKWRKDLEK